MEKEKIMPLSPTLQHMGFLSPDDATKVIKRTVNGVSTMMKSPYRRLMIGTEGESDSGKTEFMMSGPSSPTAPGCILAIDRNFDAMVKNPNPPSSRKKDFFIKTFAPLMATQSTQKKDYETYWFDILKSHIDLCEDPTVRTIGIDCDSDSWEIQRLAEWGTVNPTTGAVGLSWYGVKAARRALYARLWDSGKVIIGANKLTDEYITETDSKGVVVKDEKGNDKKKKSGNRERQGFPDQDYLWQIQLRHLYRPAAGKIPRSWGIRILKCKINKELEGTELWGNDACVRGLVEFVYPDVDPKEFGF